jgi:hypothetical protein
MAINGPKRPSSIASHSSRTAPTSPAVSSAEDSLSQARLRQNKKDEVTLQNFLQLIINFR